MSYIFEMFCILGDANVQTVTGGEEATHGEDGHPRAQLKPRNSWLSADEPVIVEGRKHNHKAHRKLNDEPFVEIFQV